MVQDKKRVAIIGGGPSGCACAYFLKNYFDVTIFDISKPLLTLLPTGGGRCNLAHNDFDIKELASNYPRGEKFLYSVFSKFATDDTLKMFEEMGVKTYIQDDGRIFPTSDSSSNVREKFLASLFKSPNRIIFIQEKVLDLKINEGIKVLTKGGSYCFDFVVVAVGGHSGYNVASSLEIKVIEPKPALTGLVTKQNFSQLSGISIKNVSCNKFGQGDILFTHNGVSGPLIYKISSLNARKNFPYKLKFTFAKIENFQELLNCNSQKDIQNVLSEFLPKSFALYILEYIKIPLNTKCHKITGKMRDSILNEIENFEVEIVGCNKSGEVVTSGGVDLNEINPKNMESKKVKNLYFIGEVLDIDGFCGGYNLQNCWSTAYVCAKGIIEKVENE